MCKKCFSVYCPCTFKGTASLLAMSDATLLLRTSLLGPQPDYSFKKTLSSPWTPSTPQIPALCLLCHIFVQAFVQITFAAESIPILDPQPRERSGSCRRAMARAEADIALTPAGSPIPDPPYITAPDGTLHPEDDDDEEAQMLQGPVSTSCSLCRLNNVNTISCCVMCQHCMLCLNACDASLSNLEAAASIFLTMTST